MPLLGGVVDRAAEDVEYAAIHRSALNYALPLIELHRVATYQVGHTLDSKAVKIVAYARADAGDLSKRVSCCQVVVLREPGAQCLNSASGKSRDQPICLANRGSSAYLERTYQLPRPVVSDTHLRQPKQIRSRRTLQRITRAALELIAEQGVEGTTISAIVRRAGSSVGSFYARFQGKDDLLLYLDESIWESAAERWNKATEGSWGDRAIPEVVGGLAKLYAEIELMHRGARDALAQALRGPGAGPSQAALTFRAKVLEDSRRFLLDRRAAINHPTPDLAVEMTCRSLEACALSLDRAVMSDLCVALVRHLTGDRAAAPPSDKDVEFFDIWG